MIEKQCIVTWYTPEEKPAPEDVWLYITISGRAEHTLYEKAPAVGVFYGDEGWIVKGVDLEIPGTNITVDAWCDLEPFGAAGPR